MGPTCSEARRAWWLPSAPLLPGKARLRLALGGISPLLLLPLIIVLPVDWVSSVTRRDKPIWFD